MRRAPPTLLALTAAAALAGCHSSPTEPYDPTIPSAWAAEIDNPWFPLIPGTSWEYEGETDEGTETTLVEVLSDTRIVHGVTAVVVHDQVFLDGELIEDTHDWYAQDVDGNVWYLGEETAELEGGTVVSTEGSWEWGVDGALPGIYMWADPAAQVGESYRQEFLEGEAEDWATVLSLDEDVDVPFGTFAGCLMTEDWAGVEGRSESLEYKYYCPDVGLALEVPAAEPDFRVELTDMGTS